MKKRNIKKITSTIIAFILIMGNAFTAFASEPVSQTPPEQVTQIFKEIEEYVNSNEDFTKISSPNMTKSAQIPLSDGSVATITLENKKIGPSPRDTVVWDEFDEGDYVLNYEYSAPAVGKFKHKVYYTLSDIYNGMVDIYFSDASIAVTPAQGMFVEDKGADIDYNDGYAAASTAFATISLQSLIHYNIYSDITMSNSGGSDGAEITVEYRWRF